MNPKQRIVFIIGVSGIALAGLIPPWHHYVPYMRSFVSDSFSRIWLPPVPEATVDMNRLLIEWVVIAVVVAGIYVILKTRGKE